MKNDFVEDGLEVSNNGTNKKALEAYIDDLHHDYKLCKDEEFAPEIKEAITILTEKVGK